jgi:hypothetical protein
MEPIQADGLYAVRLLWEANQSAMSVEIHNKCLNVELVDPLYFSDGAVCCKNLNERVAPGDTLSTTFRVNPDCFTFEGALMCGLRKNGANYQQSSADVTNVDENWSSYIQLLVGWKVNRLKGPCVYMLLAENREKLAWTKDNLAKQHNDFRRRFHVHSNSSIESTWWMKDDSVLKLTLDGVENREYGIKITISEAQWNTCTSVPVSIGPKV